MSNVRILVSADQVRVLQFTIGPVEIYSSGQPSPHTIYTDCIREMVCVYSGGEKSLS